MEKMNDINLLKWGSLIALTLGGGLFLFLIIAIYPG